MAEDAFAIGVDRLKRSVALWPIEELALRWVDRVLPRNPAAGRQIVCDFFIDHRNGSGTRLAEVMFLDCRRREGSHLGKRLLGETAAAVGVLQNLFWASNDELGYQRGLDWGAAVAPLIAASDLTVPQGLTALEAAVRVYTEKTAS